MRHLYLDELLSAIAGLAIHRHYISGTNEDIRSRIADLRNVLDKYTCEDMPMNKIPEADTLNGYTLWASTYDNALNPMFGCEQHPVKSIICELPKGRVLDAACGTGRYLSQMAELGHEVYGFDQSPEMLAIARNKVPKAKLQIGRIDAIPWPNEYFDIVICSLALTHNTNLNSSIKELARVARRNGKIIICDIHPFRVLLDYHALFTTKGDEMIYIRNHLHLHNSYLQAFKEADLCIRQCREPTLEASSSFSSEGAAKLIANAAEMAYVGLPMLLIWELERS